MSATAERVRLLVAPLLSDPDVVLYDVEYTGGTLRIVVDRPGGVDLGTITEVTRAVSAALDDADIVPNAYTLEVSSPGLERALRTPEHFAAALGAQVRIKLRPGVDGDRRVLGELTAADGSTVTVTDPVGGSRTVRIEDITKANVHVEWVPPPKPGSGGPKKPTARSARPDRDASDAPDAPDAPDAQSSSDTQSEATP